MVADLSNEHPDVKPEGRVLMASHQNALHPFIDHYSSWDRLKRGAAWLLRFFGYLSSKLHISHNYYFIQYSVYFWTNLGHEPDEGIEQ